MQEYDIVVIGGGPAGLAAAIKAKQEGIKNILLLEREDELGGALKQCIHSGFGIQFFKEDFTGTEYVQKFIDKLRQLNIEYKLNTTVFDFNKDNILTAVNGEDGILEIKAKAVIFATGCREKSRGAINISGIRSAGVYTVGTAQKFINVDGYMPGKEIVILGSGDIALITARRITLEGAKVKAVVEIMSYPDGLEKNVIECLDDFNIPLKLSYTVININGKDRVEGITIAKVDENRIPIQGTEEYISCDTVLLSVALTADNELARKVGIRTISATGGIEVDLKMQTSMKGIFACGNVLYVHDTIDCITTESYKTGENAAEYVKSL